MRTSESSGIIRTSKRSNYTVVDKTPFEDERLSWAARGVLAYLLTKPDNWQVRVNDLLKKAPGCGRDQMRGILAEIEAYGYLTREKVWNATTKRIDWDSVIHEAPQPADATKIANLESRYKRRKKAAQTPPEQSTEIQAMEQCPEIQGIEIQAIENTSIYLVPNLTNTESTKSERAATQPPRVARKARTPTQQSLDSLHEGVAAYKRMTGKTPPPVTATAIAEVIADIPAWEVAIKAWCDRGNKPTNVGGMIDWYLHPDRQAQRGNTNGKQHLRSDTGSNPERAQWRTELADEL